MTIDDEKWLNNIYYENRRLSILLVIGYAATLATGAAIGVWATTPMLLSPVSASQTAAAQPLAPG